MGGNLAQKGGVENLNWPCPHGGRKEKASAAGGMWVRRAAASGGEANGECSGNGSWPLRETEGRTEGRSNVSKGTAVETKGSC